MGKQQLTPGIAKSSRGTIRETILMNMAMMLLKVRPMQSRKAQGKLSPSSLLGIGSQKLPMFYLLPLSFLVFGVGLVSCSNSGPLGMSGLNLGNIGTNTTKIGQILQNPNVDAIVHVQGQVTNRAPLLGAGAYKLNDESGTIWVFTNQTVPNVGDEVLVKGQLRFQSIPVSGYELGEVYVQQQQLLNRKAGKPGQSVPSEQSPNL